MSAITERRDMGIYEVHLFMSFWMGTMLANFHLCGIILLLRTVLNILVRITAVCSPLSSLLMLFLCVISNTILPAVGMYRPLDVLNIILAVCMLVNMKV